MLLTLKSSIETWLHSHCGEYQVKWINGDRSHFDGDKTIFIAEVHDEDERIINHELGHWFFKFNGFYDSFELWNTIDTTEVFQIIDKYGYGNEEKINQYLDYLMETTGQKWGQWTIRIATDMIGLYCGIEPKFPYYHHQVNKGNAVDEGFAEMFSAILIEDWETIKWMKEHFPLFTNSVIKAIEEIVSR